MRLMPPLTSSRLTIRAFTASDLNAAVAVEHPTLGRLNILNQAIKLSRTPGAVVTATPERGEHSDEILGELGLSAAEVAGLRESGVIR